jgi:hypothetical protein
MEKRDELVPDEPFACRYGRVKVIYVSRHALEYNLRPGGGQARSPLNRERMTIARQRTAKTRSTAALSLSLSSQTSTPCEDSFSQI